MLPTSGRRGAVLVANSRNMIVCRRSSGSLSRQPAARQTHPRSNPGRARGPLLVVGGSLCAASTLQLASHTWGGPALLQSSLPASHMSTVASRLQDLDVLIYQYKICPFCTKVKAVLDFFGVPYQTLEVNPLTKEEIKFSKDYRKVPIARVGPDTVNDSTAIVQRLQEELRKDKSTPVKELDYFFSADALRWAEWADKQLAVLLFPNITRSFDEAYQAFSYVQTVPHFSTVAKWSNQWVGATAMWLAQGKLKKKYNIDDERAALFSAIEAWNKEVGNKPFLAGEKPNLGDLAVYACIRAIEGMDAHKDILTNTGIGPWYERVEKAVGPSKCTKEE